MATNNTKSPMFILTNGYIIKFEGFNDDTYLEGVIYEEDGIGLIGTYHQQKNDPPPNNEDIWYEMFAGKIIREAQEDMDLPIPINISSTVPPPTPIPPPVSDKPLETNVDPVFKNTTSYPMYVLEDGNVISIKRMGPQKQAIATKDGAVTFEFAPFLNSAPNIDLANEAALSLGTIIVREIPPPPPPPAPLPQPYMFPGTIVNGNNNERIAGVNIEDSEAIKVTSDVNGEFLIEGEYVSTSPLKLRASIKGYTTNEVTITDLNGNIRNDLSIIELTPIKSSTDEEILKQKEFTEDQERIITAEEKKDFIKSKTTQILGEIKIRLTPYILKMLADFGVPNPSLVLTMVEKMSNKEERQKAKAKAIEAKEKAKAKAKEAKEKAQKEKEDREKRKQQRQQEKEAENQQQT